MTRATNPHAQMNLAVLVEQRRDRVGPEPVSFRSCAAACRSDEICVCDQCRPRSRGRRKAVGEPGPHQQQVERDAGTARGGGGEDRSHVGLVRVQRCTDRGKSPRERE